MAMLSLNIWLLRRTCLIVSSLKKLFPQTESISSPLSGHWSISDWTLSYSKVEHD